MNSIAWNVDRRLAGHVRWLPLVSRELREQSRRPANFWLRAAGALALLVTTGYTLAGSGGVLAAPRVVRVVLPGGRVQTIVRGATTVEPSWGLDWIGSVLGTFEGRGGQMFSVMNLILLVTIWVIGPLMTADCLSRERRDGTLGLLFLTPMKARDIVLAKLAAHGFRAGLVFLGALPVLMLPVLVGGLSWLEVARAAMLDTGALALALSAGLLASTIWQNPRAVMVGALALAFGGAVGWLAAWGGVKSSLAWILGDTPFFQSNLLGSAANEVQNGWSLLNRVLFEPQWLWALPPGRVMTRPNQLNSTLLVLGVALALANLAIERASRHVAIAQRESPVSGRISRMETALARPVLHGRLLGRIRRWTLDHVPAAWPDFQSWRLRVAPWVALVGLAAVEVRSMSYWGRGPWRAENSAWWVLVVFGAFLGAACFHRHRFNGALELLLTTPAGEKGLVRGKAASLLVQAGPAIVFVVATEAFLAPLRGTGAWEANQYWSYLPDRCARMAVALFAGAYFSQRFKTFLPAFLAAIVAAWASGIPALALGMLTVENPAEILSRSSLGYGGLPGGVCAVLIAFGFLALLRRDLARRRWIES